MRMEKKKPTWPETVDQLKLMSEEQERNIERSIIGEGPFKVRPECQHLVVPGEKWMTMTKAQKERKYRLSIQWQYQKHLVSDHPVRPLLRKVAYSAQELKECRHHLVRNPAKVEDVADEETFQLRETSLVISRE